MVAVQITRAEWRWVVIASLGVLLLSAIPYMVGYASQTAGLRFGGAVFDRMDYNVHVACIQLGLHGEWLYSDLHTFESVRPAFVRTFYIFIGQIGRLLPFTAAVLFELVRWMGALWMLLTLYAFAAHFLWPVALRRAAFLFGALGSGFGWLMLLMQWQPQPYVSPIDFWLLDLYGFFSLLTFPHIAVVMALLWTTALVMLTHWETGQKRWLAIGVVAVVITQAIQPFAPFIVDLVLATYALWRSLARRCAFPLPSLLFFALVQIPLVVYSATFFFLDPVWQSFTQQNVTLSPAPIYFLLGLGIIGALAAWGAWQIARRPFNDLHLLLTWVLVVAVLVYLPVQFQRRFTEGVMGPVAVLAAMGLGYGVLPRLSRWKSFRRWLAHWRYPFPRARGTILVFLVAVTLPSTLYLAFGGALLGAIRSPLLFDPDDVIDGVDWLDAHSDWQDTVFSAERTGNLIPARIGHRVYLGHPFETANYEGKVETVRRFFSSAMQDEERESILRDCKCRFVFYGPVERAIGDLQETRFLQLQYVNQTVRIYRVISVP